MNWYIKLFAPLIICSVCFVVFLIAGVTDTLNQLFAKEEYLIRTVVVILFWGFAQALFFPKRPHKKRFRVIIMLCALVYPVFVFAATLRGSLAEEWTIALFLAAAVGTVSFFLRHRDGTYSLAPRWKEMKDISTLAAMGLGTVFTLLLMDEVLVEWIRVLRMIPEDWGIALLVLWGLAVATAVICYYVEAILHHRRDSARSWEKKLEALGKG